MLKERYTMCTHGSHSLPNGQELIFAKWIDWAPTRIHIAFAAIDGSTNEIYLFVFPLDNPTEIRKIQMVCIGGFTRDWQCVSSLNERRKFRIRVCTLGCNTPFNRMHLWCECVIRNANTSNFPLLYHLLFILLYFRQNTLDIIEFDFTYACSTHNIYVASSPLPCCAALEEREKWKEKKTP